MTSLLLMLISRDAHADAVLNRYEKAMSAMPSYEVQVTAKILHKADIHADMIIDNRKRFYYHATGPSIDYTMAISPLAYREIDVNARTYDEYPYMGGTQVYASRISPVWKTIPLWINASSLQKLVTPGTKYSFVGSESVNGQNCDHVHAAFSGGGGSGTVDADISADGKIYKFRIVSDSMEGHTDSAWEFSGYKPVKSFSADRFANRIPDGFLPFAVAVAPGPAPVGSKPGLTGWIDSKTGRPWNAPSGKPLLVLVAGHDSIPSDKAVSAVAAWRGLLSQKGVTLAIASDATTSAESKGLLFDRLQTNIKALSPPSTPLFYLLDSHGAVTNLWMGFEPSQSDKLKVDVLKAIAALKK